jgi:pyruvate dehydrogenase E2 component (dihydrolipoamide acetyltransferase)
MAREHCLDLSGVTGSGPGGRVVSADLQFLLASPPVVAAAPPAPAAGLAAAGQLIALTRPQRVAAERLTASYQQTPHIQVAMRVSGVWLQQFREGYRLQGRKISYNDLIIKATARALVEFPRLNSVLEPGGVRQLPQVDIGVATDTPQGLLVPVLRQVPLKSIEEIAADVARLVDAARHGGLGLDELSGGTFTISNLGMLGVSQFSAIINPPQVGILAVGALEKQVVALDNGGMAVQPQLSLTLGADHRVVDGALAARFLGRLKEILETPGLLA